MLYYPHPQGEVWDSCNGSNFYLRISQLPPGVLRGPIPPLVPPTVPTAATSASGGAKGHQQSMEELAKRMTSECNACVLRTPM